ncbi:hypothetical protein [Novosphingobium naphthalenivorans]|uniref:hypothetical protein n=1 Tax=Novosphingobium naphthalenivorans TaxID=273168 RepID=UPI0008358B79|nr:hypothetical protein [Novosphingobium naphthalenivorans]
MHKIFPVRSFAYLISVLTLGIFLIIELATNAFGLEVRLLAIPGIVWALMIALSFNPIWRAVWKLSKKVAFLPDLNVAVFPDLNGTWDMQLESNWSRQEQLLEASTDRRKSFDIRKCDAEELAPLMSMTLRAEIEQNWWSIKMTVTNPNQDSPIKESKTYIAIPRKKSEHTPASLCYFYDQTNETDSLSDDPIFSAAACLSYDEGRDRLEGTFWTARQWRRAINTAGKLTLIRG